MTDPCNFRVRRSDWRQCRFVSAPVPADLTAGQVLLGVDRFALTSNNVTYALTGDMLGYWKFFPAEEGWGRIPVMGFGDVIESRHPGVASGERVFGFFPMSTHLVVQADAANASHFMDAAPHRSESAPAYRQYTRTTTDPLYDAGAEDTLILFRGLFLTSFLVDDHLADRDFFGARSFLISSASSKTAIALAHRLSRRERGPVVGLTSTRNLSFVEGLGCYDRAIAYDDVASLAADVPVAFVDHAGDGEVVKRVHHHFREKLVYSGIVGATHWDAAPREEALPGAKPEFFFAPAQIQKRAAEWGPAVFQERLADAWRDFRGFTDGWLRVVRGAGRADVERTWRDVLDARTHPHEGHVLSLPT